MTNTISLLQRRAWNVLLANAYDRLPKQDFFEVDIYELASVLDFGAANREYLKENLEALMKSIVEWDVFNKAKDKDWKASVLLANVEISGNILTYSYSPMLKGLLYNPATYAKISLAMQNVFDSKYSLALYELCVDYYIAKHSRGETPWIEIEDYIKLLGLENNKNVQTGQFKYLNRSFIKEPVKEINDKSDLFVTVGYKKLGRKVVAVKFQISHNPHKNKLLDKLARVEEATKQTDLPLENESHPINISNRLEEYGLTPSQIKEIMRDHNIEYITEVLDMVDIKIRANKITSVPAYTYKALVEDYRPKRSLKETLAEAKEKASEQAARIAEEQRKQQLLIENEYTQYRSEIVTKYLDALDETTKNNLKESFVESLNVHEKKSYESGGLERPSILWLFHKHIADNHLDDIVLSIDQFAEQFRKQHQPG